jgi:hypothetical protein
LSDNYIGPHTGTTQFFEPTNKNRDTAVRLCSDWFDVDRNAKLPIQKGFEEDYKLYNNNHWDLLGPDGLPLRTVEDKLKRPNAVENIAFSMIEGLVAEFSQEVDVIDYPKETGDKEAANVFTDLKKHISYKNRLIWEREKWLRWFFQYGTGIWYTFWDNRWKGGKGPNRWQGDVRWISLHPSSVYPDARCKESIEDGRRIHKAHYKTIEYIQDYYPDAKVFPDMINYDMLVGEDDIITGGEANEDQVLVIETWYKGKPLVLEDDEEDMGYGLHFIKWVGDGNQTYLEHANYVNFEPEEDCTFPFNFKPCYPRENSVWGYSELFFLKNPQIMLNKTAELIIEGHVHHALGHTFYNQASVSPQQEKVIKDFGTLPHMWFKVNDVQGIKRHYGEGVPPSLENETDRLQKVMESIVGRFDISQGRTPSSVTAFRALDLLASRAQVRLRSKEIAMTSSYEEAGTYINRLIAENYNEDRAYRILGKSDDENKQRYGTFFADRYKKVYMYDTNETIPLEEFNEMTDMQAMVAEQEGMEFQPPIEGEDYEVYSPEFDVECKVSTTLPTDRIFYMDMAKELFQTQLIDGEIFWYVMKNGKFPPFEELMKKEAERKAHEEQMMQMQMMAEQGQPQGQPTPQGPPPEPVPPTLPEAMPQPDPMEMDPLAQLEALLQKRPELAEQLSGLPDDEKERVVTELLAELQ